MAFPKWLYHADCEPLLVLSEDQFKALGQGWAESPDEAAQLKPVKPRKKAQKEGDDA